MRIQHVPLEYRHQTWPSVENYIAAGLDYQDDYTLEQVKVYVTSGEWLLVVAVDDEQIHGAMTINLFNRPNDRVAFVTCVGGKGIINNDTFSQLSDLVRAFGATYVEVAGRGSVMRMLEQQGFVEKYRIAGVKL